MNKANYNLMLLGVAHSLNHSLFLILPPLLTYVTTDLGSNFGIMGIVGTFTYLIYGAGALIGGPLSDRLGSLRVARVSIGLGGLMTIIFIFARDVYVFGAGMFLMALWSSFYHPTANGLIAKVFEQNTGEAMGIHNAAGNLGQVLTPTVAYLIGVSINWRLSFVFFGVISIIVTYLLNRVDVTEGLKISRSESYFTFLKTPGLWLVLIYNVIVGFLFRSIDLFFPSFLSIERNYTGELAAIANSLILFFGVSGQLLGGRGSDRWGQGRVLVGVSFGIVVSLGLLMVLPTNVFGVALFVVLYGVSMFGQQPTVTNMVSKLSPRDSMGLAYGVMFFSAFGVGSLSTTITGFLADEFSLTIAFWFNTLIGVALLLVSLIMYYRFKEFRQRVSSDMKEPLLTS
jgi:MFS family permease